MKGRGGGGRGNGKRIEKKAGKLGEKVGWREKEVGSLGKDIGKKLSDIWDFFLRGRREAGRQGDRTWAAPI